MTTYASVRDVRDALGALPALDEPRALRCLASASADADATARRPADTFRPQVGPRTFLAGGGDSLWVYPPLLELTSVVADGVDVTATCTAYGSRIDAPFAEDAEVVVTGTWGYGDDRTTVTALDGAVDAVQLQLDVVSGADVAPGDHLVVGAERMAVTGRRWTPTGLALAADLAGSAGASALQLDGAGLYAGETVLVGAERMLVVDAPGATVAVRRAVDGAVLAPHTSGDAVLALRTLTVERTSPAAHADGEVVQRHEVPAAVRELVTASAVTALRSGQSAYAREHGPDGTSVTLGTGLAPLRDLVSRLHGAERVR